MNDRHTKAIERQARATEDLARALSTFSSNVNKMTMGLIALNAKLMEMEKGGKSERTSTDLENQA